MTRSDFVKKGVRQLLGAILSMYIAFQLVVVKRPDPFVGLTPLQAGILAGVLWMGLSILALWLMVKGMLKLDEAKDIGPTLEVGIIVGVDPKMGHDGVTPRLKLVGYKTRALSFEGWRLRRHKLLERHGWVIVSRKEYDEVKSHLDRECTNARLDISSTTLTPGKVFCRSVAPASGRAWFGRGSRHSR